MHWLGVGTSACALLLDGLLILRGARIRLFRLFPLFYSYVICAFCGSIALYIIYWRYRQVYPSAYWIYLLVTILAEFMVLVEISDHVFRPFPAIRNLGRALTILIASSLGLLYILPAILGSTSRSRALLDFALRASVTKAIILVVLFYAARHYGSQLGRNVGGLMLGFSIYVAVHLSAMASARAFGSALFAHIFWVMLPMAFALCAAVWSISLWELAPVVSLRTISRATGKSSQTLALELTRFNSELSKFMHK